MPTVTLVPTHQSFDAAPGETVLGAALRAGINLPHSCRGGHCASCRAALQSGTIRYVGGPPPGLSEAEARDGYVLLCQAIALTDLVVAAREVRPAPDVEVRSLPCRIERAERLSPEVISVHLRLPEVEAFNYRAGQYLDVILPDGRRRAFSIASAPCDGRPLALHVRRASISGFTGQLFGGSAVGMLLRIEGPLGQFWFRGDSTRPAIMVGGGTGYAPLRAMIRELRAAGSDRRIELYWGGRVRADLYEHDWLSRLAAEHHGFRYTPVLSEGEPGAASAGMRGGLVHAAVLEDHADLSGFDVYASGPPGLVDAVRETFRQHGLPADQLFFDSFDFAPDALEAMRAARDAGAD
ncbi:MAG TPA: 2Fe-2S iron-sulfur cluster-binding protein [Steroidobacteraceae bacterium]|nr:2Fe-2S iron-sulfur cluster-binding protein [Steroidobacteraceae bacterium]